MRIFLGLCLLVLVTGATANEPAVIYAQQCAVCHGDDASGSQATFSPRLAGQNAAYLREQLLAFQQGARGTHADDVQGQSMRPFATNLSIDQVNVLSSHLAGLGTSEVHRVGASAESGSTLYRDNCAACHGQYGRGAESIFVPNLAILSSWYLDAQLQAYGKGWRGGEDSSTRAKNMRGISSQLSGDDERKTVVQYLGRTPHE